MVCFKISPIQCFVLIPSKCVHVMAFTENGSWWHGSKDNRSTTFLLDFHDCPYHSPYCIILSQLYLTTTSARAHSCLSISVTNQKAYCSFLLCNASLLFSSWRWDVFGSMFMYKIRHI